MAMKKSLTKFPISVLAPRANFSNVLVERKYLSGVIEPASDLVARLFYMKSIDLDPSLGELFKSPSRAQRRKFMAAMKVTVLSLDRLQSLQPILKLLGTRQREAGVKPSHYDAFQNAWVWTLEQSLQPRFPREAKEAWSSLLGEMTRATAS